jgi:DNA-binding CsgD family transcriptional regulator
MAEIDRLLLTIGAVHGAGLDERLWPRALAEVKNAVGGVAATLEVFDRTTSKLIELHAFGLPPADEIAYLDHYAPLNPRIPALINGKPGGLVCDHSVLDERSMSRHPFYAGLLAPAGYRYFIGGTLSVRSREACLFSVQRARKQGHVGKKEIASMRLLLPHVQQAFETTVRLRRAGRKAGALMEALDWLADGALLLRADGTIAYANQAMQDIARQGDGIRLVQNHIAFDGVEAQRRFGSAYSGIARLRSGDLRSSGTADFPVTRASGAPSYLVSLRPLPRTAGSADPQSAAAVAFVHDPLSRNPDAQRLFREAFGLTEAEAALARALLDGIPLRRYASERAVSVNTVYTHLRRIKEKTRCNRLPELIRRLSDLQSPLRGDATRRPVR